MIKKYNQFVNENNQVPGPETPGSIKLDINETEAELFSNEAELGELIADQKVSLLPPHLWYMENDSDTINVLKNYFDLDKVEEEFNESVDVNSKKELEELSKRIKELQKEYDKKAKELGEKDEYKDLSMHNPYYGDDDYKMSNEEINLKGLAAGAMMALMTACNQGKVNGVSSEEYTGDMLVKKIEMDGHKHNFFVVHGLDKEGKSIEFATDNLTFNVGDSIHVDFESEKLYPLNDKDNKSSIQNYQ